MRSLSLGTQNLLFCSVRISPGLVFDPSNLDSGIGSLKPCTKLRFFQKGVIFLEETLFSWISGGTLAALQ